MDKAFASGKVRYVRVSHELSKRFRVRVPAWISRLFAASGGAPDAPWPGLPFALKMGSFYAERRGSYYDAFLMPAGGGGEGGGSRTRILPVARSGHPQSAAIA